jgi:hypothetical protein
VFKFGFISKCFGFILFFNFLFRSSVVTMSHNNNNEDVDATASPLSSGEPEQLSPALVVQLQAEISKLRQVIIYQ